MRTASIPDALSDEAAAPRKLISTGAVQERLRQRYGMRLSQQALRDAARRGVMGAPVRVLDRLFAWYEDEVDAFGASRQRAYAPKHDA